MAVNVFMTAEEAANYVNEKRGNQEKNWLDIIFLSIKGLFPAFNYIRHVGTSTNKFQRNLYKITGVKGLYEEVDPLNLNGLADDLINNRNIFSEEDCECGKVSAVANLDTEELDDPRYELFFDTKIILRNVELVGDKSTANQYIAKFGSISTRFSKLWIDGTFNGIIQSPFINYFRKMHLPIPKLLEKEMERFFLFEDNFYPYTLESIGVYLYENAFFDVFYPLQLTYNIYEEDSSIFDEENLKDIFLFYRPHIDEAIKRSDELGKIKESQYLQNTKPLGKDELAENVNTKYSQRYNPTEKETHQQIIAGLVFELAKHSSRFKRGNNINFLEVSRALEKHGDNFENKRTSEAYRRKLKEAFAVLDSQSQ